MGNCALALLVRRLRGGNNGYKGTKYEEFFGAHRIARLGRKWVLLKQDAQVEWQTNEFVVRRDDQSSLKAYQLKNSAAVSWTSGSDPIETDFSLQHSVSSAEGYKDIRVRLACSSEQTAASLAASVPKDISAYAAAHFFPYDANPRQTLLNYSWLADDFAFLSRSETPSSIEIANVAAVMMGAWALKVPTAKVSDVLSQAQSMSPQLIRSFKPDLPVNKILSARTISILDLIPDFQYAVVRGFLTWSCGRDSGVLSHDCYCQKFGLWQKHLAMLNPTMFEQIEGVLI